MSTSLETALVDELDYHGIKFRVAATPAGPRISLTDLCNVFRLPDPSRTTTLNHITPDRVRFAAKGHVGYAITLDTVAKIDGIPVEFTQWATENIDPADYTSAPGENMFPPSNDRTPRLPDGASSIIGNGKLLTTSGLAKLLGVSVQTAREMCANRTIETVALTGPRGGIRYRITPQAVNAYLNRNKITAVRTP